MKFTCLVSLACICFLTACSPSFDPKQTYSVAQIREDFTLMCKALLESHPGIYRYTSPDTIRWAFDKAEQQLTHAMTEREFRRTVNPIFSYIRCGHTDIYPSAAYSRYVKKNKPKEFPLSVFWADNKLRITQNRSKDSTLVAGSEITRIDGRPAAKVMKEMWDLIPSDGYNQTFKVSIANSNFGSFYRYLYGNDSTLTLTIRDSLGKSQSLKLSFTPQPKPSKKNAPKPVSAPKPNTVPTTTPLPRIKAPKVDKRRSLTLSSRDSTVAILDINTFRDGGHRRFYRRSFKTIQQKKIQHLVIDLRANGGGRSDASVNLMSYLLDSNYVVYDTIDAVRGRPSFNRYYGGKMLRYAARNFWSKRISKDRIRNRSAAKVLRPNKKYGFKGKVYLLTNGGSFSAAAIFPSIIQHYNSEAVTIGRETGGGQYGCNAFISPYVTLPNTRAKVRIPMFKIVLHLPGHDKGRGVMPDIPVEYTFQDVVKMKDLDIEKVYDLVKMKNNSPETLK